MTRAAFTQSWGLGGVFSHAILTDKPGLLVFKFDGPKAAEVFAHEAGGHRWQRVSPTEKRGRTHTSTITVAVLAVPTPTQVRLHDRDLEWTTCRGSGPGGQHRNKTESAVQLTHKPTGLQVRCEAEKSQHRNREGALALLRARLWEQQNSSAQGARAAKRKKQVGSGMRGDKRRTIRVADGRVHDHILNMRWRLRDYVRGDFSTKTKS